MLSVNVQPERQLVLIDQDCLLRVNQDFHIKFMSRF